MDVGMEPVTENRPVSGLRVLGFLRLARVSPARHDALVAALAAYCRSHELVLSGVFTERHVTTSSSSPAFAGLLDALVVPGVYGVLVPTISHLGRKPIAADRSRCITSAGSRLLVIRSLRSADRGVHRGARSSAAADAAHSPLPHRRRSTIVTKNVVEKRYWGAA